MSSQSDVESELARLKGVPQGELVWPAASWRRGRPMQAGSDEAAVQQPQAEEGRP